MLPPLTRRLPRRLTCLVALVAIAVVAVPPLSAWLSRLDLTVHDRILRSQAPLDLADDLAFIGIDEASLQLDSFAPETVASDPALQLMSAGYPYDRTVYAVLLDRAFAAGAEKVLIDIVFTGLGPSEAGDDALRDALARHAGKVVLAGYFSTGSGTGDTSTFLAPDPPLQPDPPVPVGFTNLWPDPSDGIVRGARTATTLSEFNGVTAHPDEPKIPAFPALAAPSWTADEPRIFTPPRLRSEYSAGYISLATFFADGADLTGKTVVIGAASPRFQDQHPTITGLHYGPFIHLGIIQSARDDAFYSAIPLWLTALLCSAVFVIATALTRRRSSHVGKIAIYGLAFVTTWLVVVFLTAVFLRSLLPIFAPVSIITAATLAAAVWHALAEYRSRLLMQSTLTRHISQEAAQQLANSPADYDRLATPSQRDVIVLAADIRSFSALAASIPPDQLAAALNRYLTDMTAIIFAHGGVVDKFMGDGILATWGSYQQTLAEDDHARVLTCAKEMLAQTEHLQPFWRSQTDGHPLEIGIGLASGRVTAGEFGSASRSQLTVIGAAVNIAARLEKLTKSHGSHLLTDATFSHLAETAFLGTIPLDGIGDTDVWQLPLRPH